MKPEFTVALQTTRVIRWQKKESARADVRKMIKRLLKKYKYPPQETANALDTVIKQCEQWTDNVQENYSSKTATIYEIQGDDIRMAAEQ